MFLCYVFKANTFCPNHGKLGIISVKAKDKKKYALSVQKE